MNRRRSLGGEHAPARRPTSRTWIASPSWASWADRTMCRGLTPASDVATLSLFGYDPLQVYTGRAPLETAAMGHPAGAGRLGHSLQLRARRQRGDARLHRGPHLQRRRAGRSSRRLQDSARRSGAWRTGCEFHRRSQLSQHPDLSRRPAELLRRHTRRRSRRTTSRIKPIADHLAAMDRERIC